MVFAQVALDKILSSMSRTKDALVAQAAPISPRRPTNASKLVESIVQVEDMKALMEFAYAGQALLTGMDKAVYLA